MLIRALAGIKDPSVKLVIVGDGPEKENLENLANYLGLREAGDLHRLRKRRNEVPVSFVANLFAMTSLHEGFGIVFMEAMHFGLPIVSTNYGGQTDFLFEWKKTRSCSMWGTSSPPRHIQRFITDKNCTGHLLRQQPEGDLAKFSADKVAGAYAELFDEIIRHER